MKARDIVGKTVARVEHDRYQLDIGRSTTKVSRIVFVDGTVIYPTATEHPDGADPIADIHAVVPKRRPKNVTPPTYDELRRMVAEAATLIGHELSAAGPDSVREHPMLRHLARIRGWAKARFVEIARKRLAVRS